VREKFAEEKKLKFCTFSIFFFFFNVGAICGRKGSGRMARKKKDACISKRPPRHVGRPMQLTIETKEHVDAYGLHSGEQSIPINTHRFWGNDEPAIDRRRRRTLSVALLRKAAGLCRSLTLWERAVCGSESTQSTLAQFDRLLWLMAATNRLGVFAAVAFTASSRRGLSPRTMPTTMRAARRDRVFARQRLVCAKLRNRLHLYCVRSHDGQPR
jgi:hypothetical protein